MARMYWWRPLPGALAMFVAQFHGPGGHFRIPPNPPAVVAVPDQPSVALGGPPPAPDPPNGTTGSIPTGPATWTMYGAYDTPGGLIGTPNNPAVVWQCGPITLDVDTTGAANPALDLALVGEAAGQIGVYTGRQITITQTSFNPDAGPPMQPGTIDLSWHPLAGMTATGDIEGQAIIVTGPHGIQSGAAVYDGQWNSLALIEHELGHTLGLGHTPSTFGNVMYPFIDANWPPSAQRTYTAADIAGVRHELDSPACGGNP